MSDNQQSYSEKMRAQGKFTISLGFDSMGFHQLDGFMMHGERTGGNLKNVDPTRKYLNQVCIVLGEPATEASKKINIAEHLQGEAMIAAAGNRLSAAEGWRVNMRNKKKSTQILLAGPQEPWNRTKTSSGPLREGVLTVHRSWFLPDEDCPKKHRIRFLDDKGKWVEHDRRKYETFVKLGTKFLLETFGKAVVYARFDGDEQAGHLQFILAHAVRDEPTSRYAKGRTMFVPSAIPNLGDRVEMQRIGDKDVEVEISGYEHAQNLAGAFFERPEIVHLNIIRAQPKAALIREAEHMIEAERKKMEEEHEAEPLFAEPVPEGSKNAVDQFLLQRAKARQDADRLLAEKKGRNVRGDNVREWAIGYLEALGVVTPEERKTHSTRNAQKELLAVYQSTFGTAEEMMADPEAVADKRVELVRKKIAEEARLAAEERAREDQLAANRREDRDIMAQIELSDELTEAGIRAREKLEAERIHAEANRKAAEDARIEADAERTRIIDAANDAARTIIEGAQMEANSILSRARQRADEWLGAAAKKASEWLGLNTVMQATAKALNWIRNPEILKADTEFEALKRDPEFRRIRAKEEVR